MSELGTCPRCARPFTSAEVAGYGILRSRSARAGGPLMELPCQGCGMRLRLIPHGDGRYALPGQPPPEAVPESKRRPPWMEGEPPPPPPRAAPEPEPMTETEAERIEVEVDEPPPLDDDSPLTVPKALRILGVKAGDGMDAIEKAFHRQSLLCHPDKVAHLDPEFQELAERKFRRLKAAFDLLRD